VGHHNGAFSDCITVPSLIALRARIEGLGSWVCFWWFSLRFLKYLYLMAGMGSWFVFVAHRSSLQELAGSIIIINLRQTQQGVAESQFNFSKTPYYRRQNSAIIP
jgi:hypothetical protein